MLSFRKDEANSKIVAGNFRFSRNQSVMGCIIDVNFNNYTEITRIFDRVYTYIYIYVLYVGGRLERTATMHVSARRVERHYDPFHLA